MSIFHHSVRRHLTLAVLMLLAALPVLAGPDWLIATGDETAQAGAPLVLEVVKPAALADWPGVLMLRLTHAQAAQEVTLVLTGETAPESIRRTYRGVLPGALSGLVRAELAGAASNRLVLVVTQPVQREAVEPAAELPPATPAGASQPTMRNADYQGESVLSPYEPMYFVAGNRGGANARFQLSFKYRILDPDNRLVQWFSPLANLYLAYTQGSIWDLGAESKPFRDTSYRPSFFWQTETGGQGRMPGLVRMGYEHESNGKQGADSRSIDMLFVRPVWRKEFADGSALSFAPKLYGYLDKTDNPDIQRYRGYIDWAFRYGHEDGWLLASQIRRGTTNRGFAQLDLSVPFRTSAFTRTGGFLMFQLFSGYGESLLDYNLQRSTQLRIGFSIVR